MTLRFSSMKELRKAISPDVEIVDDWQPTELNKELTKLSRTAQRTFLEDKFIENWRALGGPDLVREHRFHEVRRWRFDFAHLPSKVAFEIQGGLYQAQSGHRSREGVTRDYEKSNEAQRLGWKVYAVTSRDLQDRAAMERFIAALTEQRS